jgi:hypothetical protein
MEQPSETRISAAAAIRDGLISLARPPFRGLLVLAIFVSLVSNTLPETGGDELTLIGALLLIALALYLQIAVTLAAADSEPTPSVDVWVKQAFARRCFWRYFATSVLAVFMVVASGLVGLIVGGFLVGGIVALADPAVVLERRTPLEAVARSSELGKGNRISLVLIFGLLVLVPGIGVQVAGLVWDLRELAGPLWPLVPVIVVTLGLGAAVALTRTFLTLGGTTAPVSRPDKVETQP